MPTGFSVERWILKRGIIDEGDESAAKIALVRYSLGSWRIHGQSSCHFYQSVADFVDWKVSYFRPDRYTISQGNFVLLGTG